MNRDWQLWGLEFHTRDGPEHLIGRGGLPLLFRTREQAIEWRDRNFGYIRHRDDLRAPPHNWRLPKPVRVKVDVDF